MRILAKRSVLLTLDKNQFLQHKKNSESLKLSQ